MNRRQLFAGLAAAAVAAPAASAALDAATAGQPAGWIVISGRKYQAVRQVTSSIYAAGSIETRRFDAATICKWFGVPPRLADQHVADVRRAA